MNIDEIVKEANKAKIKLMGLDTEIKNKALEAVAKNIESNKEKIYNIINALNHIPHFVFIKF